MNAQTKVEPATLQALREPFPDNQISKLPKETKAQIDERKANRNSAIKCTVCGGWHHRNAVHLDYVGHAALTDRLLDTDLEWSWEPVAFTPEGLPAFDRNGGLWIRLTVLGVTRLGYGAADGKSGGDAVKEIIGDALRNAAMRFGAALDLWHKGDLHAEPEDGGSNDNGVLRQQLTDSLDPMREPEGRTKLEGPHTSKTALKQAVDGIIANVRVCSTTAEINGVLKDPGNKATMDEAERYWPTLIHGNPNVPEDTGLKGAVEAQRALVHPDGLFARLLLGLRDCDTSRALANWMDKNEALVGELDGAAGRLFERAVAEREASVKTVALANS
jgi:hypothetical protein